MKPWLITPERLTSEQIGLLDYFFDRGLERLHLRLPGAGEEDYSQVIEAVAAIAGELWCTTIPGSSAATDCAVCICPNRSGKA